LYPELPKRTTIENIHTYRTLENVYLVHAFNPPQTEDVPTREDIANLMETTKVVEGEGGMYSLKFANSQNTSLLHCSWGNLVYPHHNGYWEMPVFAVVFPLKYNLGNVYNISPFDTMLISKDGINLGRKGDFKFVKVNTDATENLFEKLGVDKIEGATHSYDVRFKDNAYKNDLFPRIFLGEDRETYDEDHGRLVQESYNLSDYDTYWDLGLELGGYSKRNFDISTQIVDEIFDNSARKEIGHIIDEMEIKKNIEIPRNVSCGSDIGRENCYTVVKDGTVTRLNLSYGDNCARFYEKLHVTSAHGRCLESERFPSTEGTVESCSDVLNQEKSSYSECNNKVLMNKETFSNFYGSF
jgi:hypothetical protein